MFTLGAFGDVDFFQMKGVVEEFLERIGMRVKPNTIQRQELHSFTQDVRQRLSMMEQRLAIWVNYIQM